MKLEIPKLGEEKKINPEEGEEQYGSNEERKTPLESELPEEIYDYLKNSEGKGNFKCLEFKQWPQSNLIEVIIKRSFPKGQKVRIQFTCEVDKSGKAGKWEYLGEKEIPKEEFNKNLEKIAEDISNIVSSMSDDDFAKVWNGSDKLKSLVYDALIFSRGILNFNKEPKGNKIFLESFSLNTEKFIENIYHNNQKPEEILSKLGEVLDILRLEKNKSDI